MTTAIPKYDSSWFAGICELGPRPLVVTGWLKQWMQGHFATASNIEDQSSPALVRNLWKPDTTLTKIAIEAVTQWVPEMTEKRPAVMISCNGWKRVRLGINDMMMGLTSPDGNNRYGNLWQGSHTLFCIAGDGAETWKLAAEVFRDLNEFGPRIRQDLDLIRFEVVETGQMYKLKQNARENFAVPVTVAYVYQESWKIITTNAPLIQKIDISLFQP